MEVIKKFLPVQCYASAKNNFTPKKIQIEGILQHYYSCINVNPERPYNLDLCWQLMHDLNLEPGDRLSDLYQGKKTYASAHFMIGRDGTILQLVPLEFQAWHAGVSEFNGRKHCNRFMVGIENIGAAGVPYTDEQYNSNAWLCAWLMDKYNIETDFIAGHEDVAPGRKKDPGELFEWSTLHALISYRRKLKNG